MKVIKIKMKRLANGDIRYNQVNHGHNTRRATKETYPEDRRDAKRLATAMPTGTPTPRASKLCRNEGSEDVNGPIAPIALMDCSWS